MEITDLTNIEFDFDKGNVHKSQSSNRIALVNEGERRIYYKLPFYNEKEQRFKGHETINEVIVSRFFDIVGIDHTEYHLVAAKIRFRDKIYELPVCASEDFCLDNEEQVCIEELYDADHEKYETHFEFLKRKGIDDLFYPMIVADYLIMNRDRYAHNIIFLKDKNTGNLRLAPLFDHGLSLLSDCYTEEEVMNFDVTKDKISSMYIGIWLVTKNLNLIPASKRPKLKELKETDRAYIFEETKGLISENHENKIWDMLTYRYNTYNNMN